MFLFLTGVTIKANDESQQLDIQLIMSPAFKDVDVNGLMGNINSDPDDDLTTPTGDTVSPNATEKVIFEVFGEKCQLLCSVFFQYSNTTF